jgi:hypothetical protein
MLQKVRKCSNERPCWQSHQSVQLFKYGCEHSMSGGTALGKPMRHNSTVPSETFTILSVKNWDTAKAVHAGYQHVWQNVTYTDVSRLFLYIFNGLYKKKETSSYNLQWQELIHVCTISLFKQNKLGCRRDTSPIDYLTAPPPPHTQKKIKLRQPAGGYDFWFWAAEKRSPLHSYFRAQQSVLEPAVTYCDDCVRQFARTDLTFCREVISSSSINLLKPTGYVMHQQV